jgi:hypothetical protein
MATKHTYFIEDGLTSIDSKRGAGIFEVFRPMAKFVGDPLSVPYPFRFARMILDASATFNPSARTWAATWAWPCDALSHKLSRGA